MRWLARHDLSSRWRSWLVIVLLGGVVAGAATATVAGWRRTTSAADRFLAHQAGFEAYLETSLSREEAASLPGVTAIGGGDYFLMAPIDGAGDVRPDLLGKVNAFSYDTPEMFRTVERSMLISGRLPDPDAADEVAIDEEMSELFDIGAGDRFRMQAYAPSQGEALFAALGSLAPTGPIFDLTATAVLRSPADIVRSEAPDDVVHLGSAEVFLGPAFHRSHVGVDAASIGALFADPEAPTLSLELRVPVDGPERRAFVEALESADPDAFISFSATDNEEAVDRARRRISTEAAVLLGAGLLLALGGWIVVDQALSRVLDGDRADRDLLRTLGLDRSRAARTGAMIGAAAGSAGALVTAAVAIGTSALMPIGAARRAEIDPGIDVDLPVIAIGMALAFLGIVSRVTISWTRSRARERPLRRATSPVLAVVDALGRPMAMTGARAAGRGSGRWAARVAGGAAATVLVAGAGFAASAGALVSDPRAWGWTFDVAIGDGNDPADADLARGTLPDVPDIEAWALLHQVEDAVVRAGSGSVDLAVVGIEPMTGTIEPAMLDGRPPRRTGEIALGAITARALGVGVGDEVLVDVGSGTIAAEVTGRALFNLGLDAEAIGEGAVMTSAALLATGAESDPPLVLARFQPGVDVTSAVERLQETFGNTVVRPIRTEDVASIAAVRTLPVTFGSLLASVAGIALVLVLVLSVRRRRRELAVMRALGCTGGQTRADVLVEALVLTVPPAAVGVVLGVVSSRLIWRATAGALGAVEVQVVPWPMVAGVVLGIAVVAPIASIVPGRLAARVPPAELLRRD